jgi:hypothetical protein
LACSLKSRFLLKLAQGVDLDSQEFGYMEFGLYALDIVRGRIDQAQL